MEMPLYKMPSLQADRPPLVRRGWMFLKRAGTLILATMIVVWALLYFPSGRTTKRENSQAQAGKEKVEARARQATSEAGSLTRSKARDSRSEKRSTSCAASGRSRAPGPGRPRAIEPAVEPLGWDWRIGMAALASFPAREVMVGTLGIIFGDGEGRSGGRGVSQRPGQGAARRRPGTDESGAQGLHGAGRAVGDGVLRPVLPVCFDAGRHQARNQ